MTIVICDDDVEVLRRLEEYCRSLPYEDLLCYTYENSMELLSDIEAKTRRVDAYILDIDMPDLSGIAIKDMLVKSGNTSAVIFLTSHMEVMQEAFGRNVVAFLSKDNWMKRLQRELDRIYRELHKCITVEHTEGIVTIQCKDIISINAADYYSRVCYCGQSGEGLLVKKTLKAWEKELPEQEMYRISRHVILNMENIERYEGRAVTMVNGDTYRLPKGTVKKFKEVYFKYVMNHERIL